MPVELNGPPANNDKPNVAGDEGSQHCRFIGIEQRVLFPPLALAHVYFRRPFSRR